MPAVKKRGISNRAISSNGGLANRVALVTGGSRGIGRAISEQLAREGAFVFVNFRHALSSAAECVRRIKQQGGAAEVIRADISRPRQVTRMFGKIARHMGRLDILVGNAGIAPVARDLERLTLRTWNETFAVNTTGAFLCVQGALPLLKRSTAGRIVFIGSAAARLGGNVGPHYAASKAALAGLVEYVSRAVGKHGITVNLVEPGFVATDLSAGLHRTRLQRRAMRKEVPLGRVGSVEDVAAAVAFLSGRGANYVTRQRLAVSGGR